MNKIFKNILSIFAIVLISHTYQAQKIIINREVETQDNGKMLLGRQSKDQFLKEPYSEWYNEEYNNYQIDNNLLSELKKSKLASYQIIAILGTWCHDSHRDFPRMMKILESLKVPDNKITIIAVNRKKESPDGEETLYNVQKVPTFIIKKYGKEIGRIVENPQNGSLEQDLLDILNKQNTKK